MKRAATAVFVVVVAAAGVVSAAGCTASRTLTGHTLDPALSLSAGAKPGDDPDDADAIVLKREIKYLLFNPPQRGSYAEYQLYQATKILTEGGFEAASTHVVVPPGGKLLDLKARTITKDGKIVPVDVNSVLADTVDMGGKSAKTHSLRFPRVEVGSILELTWTVRYDNVFWTVSDEPVERYPVKTYDVEIVLDRFTKPDLLVNNSDRPLGYSRDDDGVQHVTLHLENLRSAQSEPWRPSGKEIYPWWIYRAISWTYPAYVQPGVSSWGRAVGALHRLVVKGEGKDGPALRVVGGVASCKHDVDCLVDAALAQTRDDAVLTDFDEFFDARPLDEVAASGTANNHEKAVYLWALLEKAGLEPHLAVLARNQAQVNETFPSSVWLDHTVVYLAKPDGTALWLDPSCEHCAVGELPPWSAGSKALVVSVVAGEYGDEVGTGGFTALTGKPTLEDVYRRTIDAHVLDNGDVDLVVDEVVAAETATNTHINTRAWDQKQTEEEAMKLVKEESSAAELKDVTRWRCDRAAGTCAWRYHALLPGYATIDESPAHKGRLLMPLTLLGSKAETLLASKKARTQPVVVRNTDRLEEVLRVTVPQGFKADVKGISGGAADTAGLAVAVEVSDDNGVFVIRRDHRWTTGRWDKTQWKKLQTTMQASTATTSALLPLDPPAAPPTP